jgi:ABC-type antimicrobial peptide transport system permease subunit
MGYNLQRLVMSDVSPDVQKNYAALKAEMLSSGVVSSVTKSNSRVTTDGVYDDIDAWPGKMPGETLGMCTVAVSDGDYFKTMGMGLVSGVNFTANLGADTLSVVLNEAAVKRMRLKEPLGQTITWAETKRVKVIGVVKNALMGSPFSPAIPTMFIYDPGWSYVMTYRLADGVPTAKAISVLSGIFSKYNPSFPYLYAFVDKSYEAKFGLETLIGKLAGIFAFLAIFISCLGLFGLAAYVAEQRTKEIGVRKVLGASVGQVWMLLSTDFVVMVVIGVVVATPVSLYFLRGWLQQYDYRIAISPWVFVGAGAAALVVTLVTVSFQAVRAALMNPVSALRSE